MESATLLPIAIDKYPLITLCGTYNLSFPWVEHCVKSWKNIENADENHFFLVQDHDINDETIATFNKFGVKLKSNDLVIDSFLKKYPSIKIMREKDVSWRKIIDCVVLFQDYKKIAIIDTDVLITQKIHLPTSDFEIAYMREDVPAYRAHWTLPWKEKMVPALNAGLILVSPAKIDFNYLEEIASKYLLSCKEYWWTEQSAWSCLAGRYKKRFVFSGQDVRVLSGSYKRNLTDIINNRFKHFGDNKLINIESDFIKLLPKALIIHFAGPGKNWFEQSFKYFNEEPKLPGVRTPRLVEDDTLGFTDKLFISLRLFLKEAKSR